MELHVRKKTEGFTLTELLTVIGIVGILALIVFAVVGRLRENANAAKCVANLRQLGVLFNQNLAEMNYKIPYYAISGSTDYTWLNYLDRSTASKPPSAGVAVCPSALPKGYRDIYSIYGIDIAGAGYMNARINFPGPTGAEGVFSANVVNLNAILTGNSSRRILLADSMVRSKGAWNAKSQVGFIPISIAPGDFEGLMHFRHPGGTANFLFYDGHVEVMKFPELKALVAKEYRYTGSLGYIDSQGNEFIK
jgi:prepilin-type processing-associated H-X9-DG protein/prepilin-type N-terminal cleavage/methylation domain-containing protein